jgi:hypothetical protein
MKHFHFLLHNDQLLGFTSNDYSMYEVHPIVQTLIDNGLLRGYNYGTIGINEEENILNVFGVSFDGNTSWEEHDYNTFFSEEDLKEVRGF